MLGSTVIITCKQHASKKSSQLGRNTEAYIRTLSHAFTPFWLFMVKLLSPAWLCQGSPWQLGCDFWSIWSCHGNLGDCAILTGWIWRWRWQTMWSCTQSLALTPSWHCPAVQTESERQEEVFRCSRIIIPIVSQWLEIWITEWNRELLVKKALNKMLSDVCPVYINTALFHLIC